MKYKLIATDFDDTLLTSEKKVLDSTKEIIEKHKDKGFKIVGVTARTLNSSLDSIPIEIFDYIIGNNGAFIYDVLDNKTIYESNISKQQLFSITTDIKKQSKQIDYCSINNYYILKNEQETSKGMPDFIKPIEGIKDVSENICRMNVFLEDREDIKKVLAFLQNKYHNLNSFIMQPSNTSKQWIVVNPFDTNKVTALSYLGEKLNIDLSEMIFFGDGLNDLELIKKVGCGVAMGNAIEEVKEGARYVTTSNEEGGISAFLRNKQKCKKIN